VFGNAAYDADIDKNTGVPEDSTSVEGKAMLKESSNRQALNEGEYSSQMERQ
jgi:hypothetical protein